MSPLALAILLLCALGSLTLWLRRLPGEPAFARDRALLFWPGSLTTLAFYFWILLVGTLLLGWVLRPLLPVGSPWSALFGTALYQTLIISAAYGLSRQIRDPLFAEFTTLPVFDPEVWKWALLGLVRFLPIIWLTGLLWLGFLHGVESFVGDLDLDPQEMVVFLQDTRNPYLLGAALVLVVIGAPLAEEIAFRGILFRYLRKHAPFSLAAAVSSLGFSLLHFSTLQFIPLLTFSILLCLAYESTRDLRVCILMHAFFNSLSLLLIFAA